MFYWKSAHDLKNNTPSMPMFLYLGQKQMAPQGQEYLTILTLWGPWVGV